MSDQIKFSCLSCGQHIVCDVTEYGRQMLCPSCGANVTVPHLMETPLSAPPVLGSGEAPPSVPIPPGNPRTSGLAVASLVCALLSPVICFCCLAGIICGHLARRAIRRNPMLTGKGVATAGLILSYAALILLTAFTAFIFERGAALFKDKADFIQMLSTNPPITLETSNNETEQEPAQSSESGTGKETSTSAGNGAHWTLDVKDATIPSGPISGQIHGADFQLRRVIFRNGNLKFISADGQESVLIHNLGQSPANKSLEFQPASGDNAPKIEITWNEDGQNQTDTFQTGYAMELEFDGAKGRRIPGQIYLCLPDDSKSYIAGTFTIVLPKPKPKAAPATQ